MQYMFQIAGKKCLFLCSINVCKNKSLLCDEGLIGVFVLNSMQLMERVVVTGFEKPSTVPSF
jgi:hypothetical protein